jgi:Mesyanzhinovviridae DNA polymerase
VSQGSFFSATEMAEMSSGLCPPPPKDYVLPTAFPDLSHASRICLDFETYDPGLGKKLGNGVYRKDGYIVGGGLAAWDKDKKLIHAEYYPVAHRGGPNLEAANVWKYFADNLNHFEGELTGANVALYDGDWAQSVGIRPKYAKWRDIQWAAALTDEMAYSYSLETLGQKYLGHGKVVDHFARDYGPDYIKRFHEVHPGHARKYGIGDLIMPSEILDCLYKELDSLGMMKLYDIESRLTPMLLYMREQGVRINMQKALAFRATLEAKRSIKLQEASALCGVPLTVDNFGNTKVLGEAFRNMGITKFKRTPKGAISITDKWLIRECGDFGKALAAANKYDKAKETFIDGYVFKYAVGGRLHCEFHPLRRAGGDDAEEEDAGTEAGRFSATNPNLQNIPSKDDEIGPGCRGMFEPEEGGEWWAMDGSQIEYRWLVHFAVQRNCKGAKEAQEMYQRDPKTDFHNMIVALTGLTRPNAKNLNFGLVYGMGLLRLARTMTDNGIPGMIDEHGQPTKVLREIWDTYHAKAPFVKQLLEYWGGVALRTGEIRTELNRRSQFEDYEPAWKTAWGESKRPPLPLAKAVEVYGFDIRRGDTHKALNRKIQGSAADWMKLGMVLAWEAGVFTSTSDFTCSITCHDELDGTRFPTKRGMECYNELKHILETSIKLHVPVLVGAGVGENWADAK